MNNKLVYVPVSYEEGYRMSANVTCSNQKGVEIYLKNAFVALKSVQKYNNDVDLALVINFELSPFYKELFESNNIGIYKINFDDYKMPHDFVWSLTFFKITALKHIVINTDYQYSLQLESDEICISDFDDMWHELDYKLLMVYSPFRVDHPDRLKYSKLFHDFYNCDNTNLKICKTGAGFIAGKKDNLLHFIEVCDQIYNHIKENNYSVEKNVGDELYTSLYCALYPERVNDAAPYATVYWTSDFYYVSTNYKYDPVSIIHLPAEKTRGFITLFNYYLKNNKLPDNNFIFKKMRFPKTPKIFFVKNFLAKFKMRLLKFLGAR